MSAGFELPEDLKMLRTWMRDFIRKEIIPLEQHLDPEAIELPEEDFKRLSKKVREAGMWCLGAPERYGGGGLSCFGMAIVEEERSQHRNGLYGHGYGVFGPSPPPIIFEGTEEQIQKFAVPIIRNGGETYFAITEPSGGSNPGDSIQTTAVRDGNHWIINGTKSFITGAGKADWGTVFVRTGPKPGRAGITCFIVEKGMPGVSMTSIPVIRPFYPFEMSFQDCRVPDSNRVGDVGEGFTLLNKLLTRTRVGYSAANIGVAVAALRMSIEYAKQRVVFGEPLSRKEAIQWMLADSEVEIRAARWLIWECAWKVDRGEDPRHEASIAKLYSSEVLGRVIDRAVQIHGSYGVAKALPLERWYRESRIRRLGEGPSEVHRMVIARNLLRG